MQTNDIGNFFNSMTTIYAGLWTHKSEEMETWRKAMNAAGVDARDLQIASNRCLKDYPDFPPTLGQVLAMVKSERPMPAARRIEKQGFCLVMAQANRIMFALLMQTGGVKKETLKVLIEAKNAMVSEAKATDQEETEFAAELDTLLRGLITGHEERRTA